MRGVTSILALMLVISAGTQFAAFAEDTENGGTKTPLRVPMLLGRINIDGVLDEAEWADALKVSLNYETNPGENITPPVRTEVMLTYDKNNLYVAFRCYDDNLGQLRARLSDREKCFSDDHVNIHIDTFNTERWHYCLGSNALGVQMDSLSTGGSFDWSWDAIWDSAGQIYEWGWATEYAIPFDQLRFPRGSGTKIWGFDAWRVFPRSSEHYIKTIAQDRNNNCYQCQMLKIEGFEDIEPGQNIEINPTITAVRTDSRQDFPLGDFTTETEKADIGVTGRWGVTPNITVSGTINPDFSQVEADARQLDINEPFALYFEEKRPFFLDGANFLSSEMIDAIYTRTLRSPVWGLKLAGKEGDNSFGGFVVRDELTNLIFPNSQYSASTSLDIESDAAVFRVKRDLNNKYSIGALATLRESDDYHNRVIGLDGNFRFTDNDRVRMQLLGSSTRYPGEVAVEFDQPDGDFSDTAWELMYTHSTSSLYYLMLVEDYGKDFRADLGYVPRVDYRRYYGEIGYDFRPANPAWYDYMEYSVTYQYWEDQEGSLLRRRADLFGYYKGPMQSILAARYFISDQAYDGELFDVTYFGTYSAFQPTSDITLELDTSFGDQIDYANTRMGNRVRLQPGITWRLGKNMYFDLSHEYEQLKVDSERLYTANVTQGSAVYQLNARTFLRAILQYVDYDYNVDLYLDEDMEPRYRHLFSQLLFSYKINPRTVLFLGYTDNYYGEQAFGLTQADKTLFAKIGYAWQL